jgi:superfamily II DNA or RNA helicase
MIDCKHAAAAVIEFFNSVPAAMMSRQPASDVAVSPHAATSASQHDYALTQWLERLEKLDRPAPRPARPPVEEIVYLLSLERWPGPPRVQVTICKGRRRKKGGHGSITIYDPRMMPEQVPRFIHGTDLDIFSRLRRAEREWSGQYSLSGQYAAGILSRLSDSGRCYWESAENLPLKPGSARCGRWVWEMGEDGSQSLTMAVEPDALSLPTEPPWYLDSNRRECGPLHTDVPDAQARALLQAPRLSPAQIQNVHDRLAAHLPSTLPRPRLIEVEVRKNETLTPVLKFDNGQKNSLSFLAPGEMSHAWAELRFDYNGNEITAVDRRQNIDRMQDGRLVRIERNREAELATAAALDDFDPYDGYLPSAAPEGAITLGDFSEDWLTFMLVAVPELRNGGWRVEIPDDFPLQMLGDSEFDAEIEEGEDWFGVGLGIDVGGEKVNLLPLLLEALSSLPARHRSLEMLDEDDAFNLPLPSGRLLTVPVKRVKPILNALIELYDNPPLTDEGRLKLSRLDAARLADIDEADGLRWRGGESLKKLGRQLRNFDGIKRMTVPRTFKGELRDYQHDGVDWLQFLRRYEFGGILADDMGLGKTVQTLAHLLVEKRARRLDRPSLLVAPTSLLHNWRAEADRFAPSLRLLTLRGADRADYFDDIEHHDVVLTTYPLLPRDADALKQHDWHYVILDEAQTVKNPRTKAARVLVELKARHRICLTGTPMENHLGELWSLFRFLMPGFLGDSKQFRRLYRTPVEKHGDAERREHLARRVRPFLLRRTKSEVAAELPPKTEMVRCISLEGAQRDLYESVRLAMHKKVRDVIANKGFARSQIEILEALLRLRQVCCDPRLLKGRETKKNMASAKLKDFKTLLSRLLEEDRRVLVFSQFTEMLGLIEAVLADERIGYSKLTGRTINRAAAIEQFQRGKVPLMLVSLKAGGVGLNLTAADAVIHYDPWWNPAVESQATDRAHRIGQDKPVFVYKLICEGTVEERIQAMQARKQALLEGVYAQGADSSNTLGAKDFEMLFEPLG